jgi:Tol biopolymer transport system component
VTLIVLVALGAGSAACGSVTSPSSRTHPTAWSGHGELAFVAEGRLHVVRDDGERLSISGPPTSGSDTSPAWSFDHRWLAFFSDVAGSTPYAEPLQTLWIVAYGSTNAREVTSSAVAQFMWSPTAFTLAYVLSSNATTAASASPPSVWLYTPGRALSARPSALPAASGVLWSPDGTELAGALFRFNGAPGSYTSMLTVAPVNGGAAVTWVTTTQGVLEPTSWWPDGKGLLYWFDTQGSASIAADGLPLMSVAEAGRPEQLATTLVWPSWVSWSPDGRTVAIVSGGDRVVWGGNKEVSLCDVETVTCKALAIPSGTVGLAPSWSGSGALFFSDASAAGAFGPNGDADFSSAWIARWDATSELWDQRPGAPEPAYEPAAGKGVVDAVAARAGPDVLLVRHDALWLFDLATAKAPVEVAGPLLASGALSGFYGQVDWQQDFAWSMASSPAATS